MSTCLLRGRSTPAILAIFYPCLCLCFEFSQITRTTPLRCTILHLSQIFFTDALTFMNSSFSNPRLRRKSPNFASRRSFIPVGRPSPGQVLRREFHRDLISGKNADEVLTNSAGDVREHLMFVLQFHPEHGIGQRLNHRRHNFYSVLFAHSAPVLAASY